MDPQMEEYRQRQRERAAREAAAAGARNQTGIMFGGALAATLVVLCAVVYQGPFGPAQVAAETNAGALVVHEPRCPDLEPGAVGMCVEECSSNSECDAGLLCCSNGCGHTCVAPAGAHTEDKRQGSTIMVTLHSNDVVPELLEAAPTPEEKKHLYGVGILILTYSQDSEACRAFAALARQKGAKAIEWDGRQPKCEPES